MNEKQIALQAERTRLVKVWDINKASLRRKRKDFGLDEADWKRWDEIDAFYGGKVAIIELAMYKSGMMM